MNLTLRETTPDATRMMSNLMKSKEQSVETGYGSLTQALKGK
ncbi:MAG: hypothetical protein VCA18_11670 [Opitutales bacterium]